MKKLYTTTNIKRLFVLAGTIGISFLMMNYSSGPANNGQGSRVGASFSNGTCAGSGCHSGGSFNTSISIQLLDGTTPVTSYTASKSYTLRISLSGSGTSSSTRYGFQAVSVQTGTNSAINNWGTLPSGVRSQTISGRTHVEHNSKSSSNTFDIPWTAPSSTSTGNITFYVAGNIVNNNGAVSGDSPATDTFMISPPCQTPTLSTNATNVACRGGSTGAITLNTTGGTGPFSYLWSGPGSFSSTSKSISNLIAGTYKVVVTANGGCKDSTTVTITQPATAVSVTAGIVNSTVCEGDSIILSANGNGGTGAIKYSWSGPNSYSSTLQNPIIHPATPLMSGNYTVVATDANNCSRNDQVTVTVNPLPSADTFTFSQGTTASDSDDVTFAAVNVQNADSTIWIFGDGSEDRTNTGNVTHTYGSNGAFTVMLITKNSCGSDTVTTQINVEPLGISNLALRNAVRISPNPASNVLIIENQSNTIRLQRLTLTDVTGRVVHSEAVTLIKQNIDVSMLPAGNYYLTIEAENGMKTTEKVNIIR